MLSGRRILVVEREFLVALDIQRVLEDADAASTVFARSIDEAAHLKPRFSEYDLAIIEFPPGCGAGLALVQELTAAGVGVIVTATERLALPPTVPRLDLPFADAELVAACLAVLGGAPPRLASVS